MKKYLFLAGLLILISPDAAYAANDCVEEVCKNFISNPTMTGCASASQRCYNGSSMITCNRCESGWESKSNTVTVGGCSVVQVVCAKCTGCSNCNDSLWSSAAPGHEVRQIRTCNCNTCSSTPEFRCAAGYYGSPSNGSSGCTACPSGSTSSAGSTSKSDCCESGDSGSDGTGSWSKPACCYS